MTSIHALHAEGDRGDGREPSESSHFNPRPPCGGRPSPRQECFGVSGLQSTPSMRRATIVSSPKAAEAKTSIHALHAEGDLSAEEMKAYKA